MSRLLPHFYHQIQLTIILAEQFTLEEKRDGTFVGGSKVGRHLARILENIWKIITFGVFPHKFLENV